jgi:hypothetical protein
MSSGLRAFKEPTSTRRQFAVHPYRGVPSEDYNVYFFTVQEDKLYRIENDLSGAGWVVARDMGAQRVINSIDAELIEFWETNNQWSNIKVIRPGIARKFQVLSMVHGNYSVSYNNEPAWNAGAYLDYDNGRSIDNICNLENNTVNDMLVVGGADNLVLTDYTQSLEFGTFWAMNDPVVIEYEYSLATYRRAIKNRIDETTLF